MNYSIIIRKRPGFGKPEFEHFDNYMAAVRFGAEELKWESTASVELFDNRKQRTLNKQDGDFV